MIIARTGLSGGLGRERRRKTLLSRRQPLGHGLMNSLVEWWPLAEQTGNRLGVHAGLHLTDNNSVGAADGVGSLASQFTNASSRFLSRTSEAALQAGNQDFTLVAWIYLDSKSQSLTFLSKASSDTSREFLVQYVVGSDRFRFLVYDGAGTLLGNVSETTFGSPSTATWYMITVAHNAATTTVLIHVNNGAAVTAATTGTPGTNSSPFNVGASNTPFFQYWDGRIQRVGYWKRVLTADERTYLYNSGRGRDYPFA